MSYFSPLQWSGTAFYGDPFGPIIDVISDFGWSLLPQFPGSIGSSPSSGGHVPPSQPEQQEIPIDFGIPVGEDYGYAGETTGVYPVYPGPSGVGGSYVPTSTVVVEGVSTEVEHHPEGDFPAGSIFAPGGAWGQEGIHLLDREESPVAVDWGGILDWGLDTLAGQQPWQLIGGQRVPDPMVSSFAAPTVPVPSGVPGQPTTITGYTGGQAMTGGNDCGNRRYVTLDRETGKISCKRRRRRRLLTNRDLADLASLKTITGGGAALNAAVIRAVR